MGFLKSYDPTMGRNTHLRSSHRLQERMGSNTSLASNGQAERTVQTVKNMLKKSSDPHLALLNYRATPLPWCHRSPAELLMGRALVFHVFLVNLYLRGYIWKEEFRELNDVTKHSG